ncbi:cytochrome P450 [Mycena alexandri]|uniref:Cytochrome P450 n=1 Tax=Mycena alexandri TaxID=1745969 RepID=A0AAD6S5I2_9AGAR|nr:cytochrome P450 [Mycena alexandri]
MILQALVPLVGTLLFYILYHVGEVLYHNLTSPLRHVGGPKSPSILVGNFKEMAENPVLTKQWRDEFGSNFRFKGLFSVSEFHTSDLKAVTHIVTNGSVYQKAPAVLVNSQRLLGKGLLGVERNEHKRQRRILNPAFGVMQIRLVTEIFLEKAVQLRDIWSQQVEKENGARIEVLSWLRKMTLDVIGQAVSRRPRCMETPSLEARLIHHLRCPFCFPSSHQAADFRCRHRGAQRTKTSAFGSQRSNALDGVGDDVDKKCVKYSEKNTAYVRYIGE